MSGGKLLAGSIAGLLVAGAAAAAVTIPGSVKEIEFIFYDKEKKDEKKIRFAVDGLSRSSLEIHKDSKWTKEIGKDDKEMYEKLFDIASKYLMIQDKLNVIKTNSKTFETSMDSLCKGNDKCCCKPPAGKAQCDCTKDNCATCLCCYLEEGKCCTDQNKCNLDKFKKVQKTFAHLRKNIDSGYHNIYLTPMQAYIKFPDLQFSELKDLKDEKPFIGTVVYGFSDYSYKPIKYRDVLIPKDQSSNYETLSDNKDYYFANIPQTFMFSKKDKQNQKETNIEKIIEKMEEQTQMKDLIEKLGTSAGDCCKENNLECLINRSYVFLEETNVSKISDKIKNAEDCCAP